MNREDFPILKTGIIHFDNGATSLKPQAVIDKIVEYYSVYTSNAHRGDYDNSVRTDSEYENVRTLVRDYIKAEKVEEIVFNKGASEGINQIVFSFMSQNLEAGDEIILTKAEHASNILPWLILAKEKNLVIKYAKLNDNLELELDAIKNEMTEKTKVIAIAHVTNTIGDVRPIREIGNLCDENNIYFVVDAAQSIGHIPIDVNKTKISFLVFSAHKMLGPTGVGVLYAKLDLLNKMQPYIYGGGMNSYFEVDGTYEIREVPVKFEGGTPNIAGVIGLGAAINYINEIGLARIHAYELELKKYAISQMETVENISIYNKEVNSSQILFNIDGVFSQDTALFLNNYNINVRSGNHCAKVLKDELGENNTCRLSLYFYNSKEEIDQFIDVLKKQDQVYDKIIG